MKNKQILVWPACLRLLHWLLVGALTSAWLTRSTLNPTHDYSGLLAAGLIVLRLIWGWRSQNHWLQIAPLARRPAEIVAYLHGLSKHTAPRYLGHNPLGGWMILALATVILATAASGWLYTTDWLWGYGWLATGHALLGSSLLALAGLHVLGVIFSSLKDKENLVLAMLTGRKRADDHPPR